MGMFPSIENIIGIKSVIRFLDELVRKDPPAQRVMDALEMSLSCNNLAFNKNNYIQTDTRGPDMLGSYSDIDMAGHDSIVLVHDFSHRMWERFNSDVFVVWTRDTAKLSSLLDYLNNIDDIRKITFTLKIADKENG